MGICAGLGGHHARQLVSTDPGLGVERGRGHAPTYPPTTSNAHCSALLPPILLPSHPPISFLLTPTHPPTHYQAPNPTPCLVVDCFIPVIKGRPVKRRQGLQPRLAPPQGRQLLGDGWVAVGVVGRVEGQIGGWQGVACSPASCGGSVGWERIMRASVPVGGGAEESASLAPPQPRKASGLGLQLRV